MSVTGVRSGLALARGVWAASLAISLSIGLVTAGAQEQRTSTVADTASPRDTMKSFIDACNALYEVIRAEKYLDDDNPLHARLGSRIVDCVDVSDIPAFARAHRAAEVAVCIKEIIDREPFPDWEAIPDTHAIEKAGGLERLPRWRLPGTRITIARVEEGPQKHEYLFSPGTVDRAVSYYQQIRTEPYRQSGPAISEGFYDWYVSIPGNWVLRGVVESLPERMQRSRIFGIATWKWLGMLLTVVVGISLMVVAYRWQWSISERVRGKSLLMYCLTIALPLFAVLVPIGVRYMVDDYLTVRGTPLYVLTFISDMIAVLAAVVLVFAVANRVAETVIASPHVNPQGLNAQLIRIVAKLASLVASLIVFVVGGHYLGIQIGTLLASAGIFGAAIALGAQDTLKNLFATMALLGDKPFRVGDRIIFNEYDGIVEDIGLRSTRVRLLTGHVATLPNDRLVGSDIENVTSRRYIRRIGKIQIPLNTPREKLEKAVALVRGRLDNHEGMDPEFPPRVFFDEFNPDAFTIQFFYWYSPPDYWDFKAFSDQLNFDICRDFEEHGIRFELPSRHTLWKHDNDHGALDVTIVGNDARERDDGG